MRVVLDVNVLVCAALSPTPGQLARGILDQARTAAYTLLVCDFVAIRKAGHFADTFRGVGVISPEAFLAVLRQGRALAHEEGASPEAPD
ncbi:MAG: hypothetical protein AB1505_26135 [Candidatus Latescibacterota bacterium]